MSDPTLSFLGGAGTVTGSKYLVKSGGRELLLDCGLFQGLKALRERNRAEPPFDARQLDCVVLSHAHLDHSGGLPMLTKRGFRGPIYCTPGTAALLEVLLMDSARLQVEDAARANRYGYSKHTPALPLYTEEDVAQVMELLSTRPYQERFSIGPAGRVMFRRAGHILGSATVELQLEATKLVFSGDLGRWNRPIVRDPELVPQADVLLVESTYGDRVHPGASEDALVRIINETASRGGVVVVPSFAIGRTQELIWTLRKLEDAGRLPSIPVFIDTPMGADVTRIYCEHPEDHDLEMTEMMDKKRCPLCCRQYEIARSAAESKAINARRGPMVIIAGSGMATGGRVLHHLKHRLPDEANTVLLVGYQAAGTRGRSLQGGAKFIRIHGADVRVRAHVEMVDGLSAHADRDELLRWLRGFERPPAQTWVVHGEPRASSALATDIHRELKWTSAVAQDGATVELPTGEMG